MEQRPDPGPLYRGTTAGAVPEGNIVDPGHLRVDLSYNKGRSTTVGLNSGNILMRGPVEKTSASSPTERFACSGMGSSTSSLTLHPVLDRSRCSAESRGMTRFA